jgi:hypothetical protein
LRMCNHGQSRRRKFRRGLRLRRSELIGCGCLSFYSESDRSENGGDRNHGKIAASRGNWHILGFYIKSMQSSLRMAAATAFGHRLGLLSDCALLGSGGHLIGEFHLTDPGWISEGAREMSKGSRAGGATYSQRISAAACRDSKTKGLGEISSPRAQGGADYG